MWHVTGGIPVSGLCPIFSAIQQTQNICITFVQCWTNVEEVREWANIALRRFLHNHGNIATEGSSVLCLHWVYQWVSQSEVVVTRVNTMPCSYLMTSRVLYSAQYHRQHCTLQAFEQFQALYMHNLDDKYSIRPGFEPSTPWPALFSAKTKDSICLLGK